MNNLTKSHTSKTTVSIGLPVYNGEKFLQKRLESILTQTFENFELIISDNNSTDLTEKIRKDFLKSDNRIKYYRQKKNIGLWMNFNFVLQKATSDYFVWAAVDDLWDPEFLKKNTDALESNEKIISSISKIHSYEISNDKNTMNSVDFTFRNIRKKILKNFRSYDTFPFSGKYEKKIRSLLKKSGYLILYSVFRTNVAKKSWIKGSFVGLDAAFGLNLLKYGDANVINESLIQRYADGISTKGSISLARQCNYNLLGIIFPHYPLTNWAIKNLGPKIFLKNLDHFILLNIGSEIFLLIDAIRLFMNKIRF